MNWINLTQEEQLTNIKEKSFTIPQVVFKHSTRCSISSMALKRMERAGAPEGIDFYFLDLLAHRNVSNAIAEVFKVYHESPQVILIKNGEAVYDESHTAIDMDELKEQASLN
jgi:bacillithiol system protein YtxJ